MLSGHLASLAEAFRGIPQFLQAHFRALSYIQPLTIPFSSLPVHYSLIILPVDAIHIACY